MGQPSLLILGWKICLNNKGPSNNNAENYILLIFFFIFLQDFYLFFQEHFLYLNPQLHLLFLRQQ